MKSRWNDAEAARAVAERKPDVSEALALRTYSARLLGADGELVLHGGGNTSVKSVATTTFGEAIAVLHVKGSGWDLATIEPPGHPAVRMDHLQRLLGLASMSDEAMVNELRLALLDANAPTPSVETLLHAALPATYIDHTHADAILALVDQENGRAICEEIFGAELLWIPYVMPGFGLARACKQAWDEATKAGRSPTVMVLERHGVFTFGATAKESYERMIDAVTRAERYGEGTSDAIAIHSTPAPAADWPLAVLRGAFARAMGSPEERAPIVTLRSTARIHALLERADARKITQRGCATPDHVIRTKPWPLHLAAPPAEPKAFAATVEEALRQYAARYDQYFEAAQAKKGPRKKLDPWPRVVLVPGFGLCAVGKTRKDADIAADIYEHTIDVIVRAESVGQYAPLGLDDLFDVEYWSLEQAKLAVGASKELPLSGRVALVTGAGSGIGRATAAHFVELGAHVVLVDRDEASVHAATGAIGKKSQTAATVADVTDAGAVRRAFQIATHAFGGVDLVVSNAGAASEGRLDDADGEKALRASLELNLLAHVNVARSAVETMRLHRRGGALLFNASKSAFNQGPAFGPYAVPKAALVSLMRQYAVDLAADRIRSNAVNADRIRTGIFEGGMLEARAKSRGLTVDDYFRANLLQREVTARDVASAFAWLAQAPSTTGCVITVDGGNAAAFPR